MNGDRVGHRSANPWMRFPRISNKSAYLDFPVPTQAGSHCGRNSIRSSIRHFRCCLACSCSRVPTHRSLPFDSALLQFCFSAPPCCCTVLIASFRSSLWATTLWTRPGAVVAMAALAVLPSAVGLLLLLFLQSSWVSVNSWDLWGGTAFVWWHSRCACFHV